MMEQNESISYEGLKTLFRYLEEYEDDIGEEVDFNPFDLHMEFSEFDEDDLLENYDVESIGELRLKTTVIHVEGTSRYIANTIF